MPRGFFPSWRQLCIADTKQHRWQAPATCFYAGRVRYRLAAGMLIGAQLVRPDSTQSCILRISANVSNSQ